MTRVLVEQTAGVDPQRLGEPAGLLTFDEMRQIEAALRHVLDIQFPNLVVRLDSQVNQFVSCFTSGR